MPSMDLRETAVRRWVPQSMQSLLAVPAKASHPRGLGTLESA